MATKPPPESKDPKKMTSRSKKFQGHITLWRNAMQIREGIARSQEGIARSTQALDNIFAELFEEDVVEASQTTPVPIEQPPFAEQDGESKAITVYADQDRPSKRPTHLYPAVRGKTIVAHFIRMWSEANSEHKKDQVRDVVKKGLQQQILTQEDYDEIVKHFV